jgi:hypothetical protein
MGPGDLAMKKLIFRLLVLILSVYLAGSIYPLLAHEHGHTHAPAPAPAPTPPTAPTPPPSSPAGLDAKTPPIQPQASLAPGGGGCGPEVTRPYYKAELDLEDWKDYDFDDMANGKIDAVKGTAKSYMYEIKGDIKRAQDRFHKAHMEVDKVQAMKKRGTLMEDDFLKDAQEDLQKAWAELQQQKARLKKVEAWRSQKTREIWALRDRAKNGDYSGYLGLKNFNTFAKSSMFK